MGTYYGALFEGNRKYGKSAMRGEAVAIGEQVISAETALDALFRSGSADAGLIEAATAEVASLYGRLRAAICARTSPLAPR